MVRKLFVLLRVESSGGWYRSVQNLARPSLLRNAGKPSVPSRSTYRRRSNFKPLRSKGFGKYL